MIKHIVVWKLKDEANGASKLENAKIIKQKLEARVGLIDEIKSLEVGININEEEAFASDLCLITEFDDMQALGRYQVNPDHKAVSGFVREVCLSRTIVDYEF